MEYRFLSSLIITIMQYITLQGSNFQKRVTTPDNIIETQARYVLLCRHDITKDFWNDLASLNIVFWKYVLSKAQPILEKTNFRCLTPQQVNCRRNRPQTEKSGNKGLYLAVKIFLQYSMYWLGTVVRAICGIRVLSFTMLHVTRVFTCFLLLLHGDAAKTRLFLPLPVRLQSLQMAV